MITTQKEFFAVIAEKTGMTQKAVKDVYDKMLEVIVESANSADETKTILPEIGTLVITPKEAYTGKNPKTNEAIEVPASRRARVKIAPKFAENFAPETVATASKAKKASKPVAKKVAKKK